MPNETPLAAEDLSPVQRVKFDRWLWDRDLDNVKVGALLEAHPLSVGRWRKRFDDLSRRVPPREMILKIERITGGEVTLVDWYRPSLTAYVEPAYPEGALTAAAE